MIADIAVPFRVFSSFHYAFDADQLGLQSGSIVEVNFNNRTTHGFVLGVQETTDCPPQKLKNIESMVMQGPLFDNNMLSFLKWVSEYYCYPLGEVLATALPVACWKPLKRQPKKIKKVESELSALSGGGVPLQLSAEQTAAIEAILKNGLSKPTLLHGVTGSGKTEVYIRLLSEVLGRGQTGIVLVPEIALTPQLVSRFSHRFPGVVAVLHSDLKDRERRDEWNRIRSGEARLVVGARSAVFAPVQNLGLILVDEEHEPSFKQEENVRYHARDLAVVRGQMAKAMVVLGSATPSVESYYNARSGKYLYSQLTKRIEERPMPTIRFVDIRQGSEKYSPQTPWLSRVLVDRVSDTLKSGQQVLLYLNRLGFAHFLYCEDCGHSWRCNHCDVALTYYRVPPRLKCHYCGHIRPSPSACESCSGTKLTAMGLGTEQVETQFQRIFPQAKIARMDRSQITNRLDLENLLIRVAQRDVDILIGTQMVTKGHDFPGISLVGVLIADASLNIPDFRAQERTYQIVTQVSGRAGRASVPGEVIIQTVNPEHPVLQLSAQNKASDYYQFELLARRQFGFPPYRRLAALRFQHSNPSTVERFAVEITDFLKRTATANQFRVSVLGPAEAPLARIKNLYRWHCLVKADSVKEMQSLLKTTHEYVQRLKSPVQFGVDVDPVNSL